MLLQAAATAAGASVPNPGQIGLSDCLKNFFFFQKNKLSEEEEPLKAEQKYAADGRRRISNPTEARPASQLTTTPRTPGE